MTTPMVGRYQMQAPAGETVVRVPAPFSEYKPS